MTVHQVPEPADRPYVEVLVDGRWCPGELRMWAQGPDGWIAQVEWRRTPGELRIGTFPAERVRRAHQPS